MKTIIKKLVFRILTIIGFCLFLLVTFLLNPSFLYAHKTVYKNITIYHQEALSPDFQSIIDLSLEQIAESKLYEARFKSDLCLNDGSYYPKLVEAVLGADVFTAFSNKVVVLGQHSDQFNRFELWEQDLKFSQFLTHGLMHNLQFRHHGLLDANPLGNYPQWKWEGYVEYETLGDCSDLRSLIEIVLDEKDGEYDWIDLGNGNRTLKRHVRYLAMTKFCFEILGLSYEDFLSEEIREKSIFEEIVFHY